MSTVLDSTIVIDALRMRAEALDFLRTLRAAPVCSEATRVEVLRGLRHHEQLRAEEFFDMAQWVPVDETIARRAGEYGRTWRRSHPGISTEDLIIAATASETHSPLATLNVKHFPMFKGLRPPYRSI